jgi:hypothetical protein
MPGRWRRGLERSRTKSCAASARASSGNTPDTYGPRRHGGTEQFFVDDETIRLR